MFLLFTQNEFLDLFAQDELFGSKRAVRPGLPAVLALRQILKFSLLSSRTANTFCSVFGGPCQFSVTTNEKPSMNEFENDLNIILFSYLECKDF